MAATRSSKPALRKNPSIDATPARPQGQRHATVHEAKTHLSRLLAEVETGETVIITRRGKPVAKLEAVAHRPKRVFGCLKGQIAFDDAFFDPLPDDELDAWGQA